MYEAPTGDQLATGRPEPDVPDEATGTRDRVGRAALTLTVLNLLSRITGFGRVVATASALGFAGLGDAYQSASASSNLLFELLAGGLLFSVLVPTFVARIDREDRLGAARLGGTLLARLLVVLGVVAAVGIVFAEPIMRVFTAGVSDPVLRAQEIKLGSFLLWFFMPQLLLYATGAVVTALLQADRRFTAAALAPVFNNVVVIGTMVAFAVVHKGGGLDLTVGEKLLLGGGTLAGTVAMTAAPWFAAWRAGLDPVPRWRDPAATGLRDLAMKGLWGAGHVGLNEVLSAATLVFAGRVVGGQLAYQTAFTFFLLPHAVLAHPIFTALFPRISTHAASGNLQGVADDLAFGLRSITLLILPAAGFLAVVALPTLTVVRIGHLDARGAQLVAWVLAAYCLGLPAYSLFFLLTRVSYALGDARLPTLVNLGVTTSAIAGMAVASSAASGDGRVVVLGLVTAVCMSVGGLVLFAILRRRLDRPVPALASMLRGLAAAAVATGVAHVVAGAVGWDTRANAVVAVVAAGTVGVLVYVAGLLALRTPDLEKAIRMVRNRLRKAPTHP